MNKNVRWIFLVMSLVMAGVAIKASMMSNMFQLPEPVLKEPWFWATLADFYNNMAIVAVWVVYKENNFLRGLLWVLALIVLGSIASAFYVFLQISKLKEGEGIEAVLVRRA